MDNTDQKAAKDTYAAAAERATPSYQLYVMGLKLAGMLLACFTIQTIVNLFILTPDSLFKPISFPAVVGLYVIKYLILTDLEVNARNADRTLYLLLMQKLPTSIASMQWKYMLEYGLVLLAAHAIHLLIG